MRATDTLDLRRRDAMAAYRPQREWIEGREDGERSWTADTPALLEDENTVNWFFNRGTEPATAIVCDIKPAK